MPHVNSYPIAPKLMDQGLGEAANPAGTGKVGGVENAEFDS